MQNKIQQWLKILDELEVKIEKKKVQDANNDQSRNTEVNKYEKPNI